MKTTLPPSDAAPAQAPFVAATMEEILHAEALRRAIKERYLAAAQRDADRYWCVGAD